MKLKRIEPGVYQSVDGRVLIQRRISKQTYRADDVSWSVYIDGKERPIDANTKREAVAYATLKLSALELSKVAKCEHSH